MRRRPFFRVLTVTERPMPQITIPQKRSARRDAYLNAGIWSLGNGLAGTLLVIHFAYELDAKRLGLGISLILAVPQLIGVLRLFTPLISGRLVSRKRFCVCTFLIAAILLALLPILAKPGLMPTAAMSLAILVLLWGFYHLFQYFGTVALWTWLADLVPQRIRGRFIGRRERWLVAGQAISLLAVGVGMHFWKKSHDGHPGWLPYFVLALSGAVFMILAVIPLGWMPRIHSKKRTRHDTLHEILAPFFDRNFLRLLVFGCTFSLFNGLTNSAHYLYPNLLGMGLVAMLTLRTVMRVGQIGISPSMGRLVDRLGNRRVMIACGLIVSQGPLFYFFSSPDQPWWFAGAWIVWIAYAGINVGLPNLMLKLSPQATPTPYVAAYFATTGVFLAASTILGGWLFDTFGETGFTLGSFGTFDYYSVIFLVGWLARMTSVLVLWAVVRE